MRSLATAAALVVALGALSAGCGRSGAKVQTAVGFYEHGAYEGALIKLRDADESQLRTKTRARYLAYRGLTHWHLHQNDEARRYLASARKAFADGADPKWLPADIREELTHAEGELGLAEPTLPRGKTPGPAAVPNGSSPPDRPSAPGTPPGPPDGAPVLPSDKPPSDASPSSSPSSPTSSPGAAPSPTLPSIAMPPPEPL